MQRENHQEEVGHAEKPAESHGGRNAEESGSALLLNQNGALPYGLIPEADEERGRSGIWVVSIQDRDPRAPAQALQAVETAAEDSVGGATKGTEKRQEPVHGPGPVRGRAVH